MASRLNVSAPPRLRGESSFLDFSALHEQAKVKIVRKRGRIAGFAAPSIPVDILWCGTNRPRRKHGNRRNGWSFPPAVRELLLQETQGLSVVHLFGGQADFGLRMDIDPATRPHVVGDAFLPPFPRDFCDVVILDPPYHMLRMDQKKALMWAAAWIARKHVYWFSTVWIHTELILPEVHGLADSRGRSVRRAMPCKNLKCANLNALRSSRENSPAARRCFITAGNFNILRFPSRRSRPIGRLLRQTATDMEHSGITAAFT